MTVSVKAPTSTTGSIQLNGSDVLTIDSSGNVTAPNKLISTGHVLQVLQATKTDAYTTTNTSYNTPTGLSVSITPSSTSSKILVIPSIDFGVSGDSGHTYARIYRDSTSIFEASTAGGRNLATFAQNNSGGNGGRCQTTTYIDSPSTTSSITYSIQIKSSNGTTVYVNRSVRDADSGTFDARTVSSITVMEVAG